MLVDSGGRYTKGPDWQPHVVTDGKLIAGQTLPPQNRPRAPS
jgi:hypothetical protein